VDAFGPLYDLVILHVDHLDTSPFIISHSELVSILDVVEAKMSVELIRTVFVNIQWN
jgi:hypothetical protein